MGLERDADEILRRRLWLKQNFEWFMTEVVFHRDMKPFFSGHRIVLWRRGELNSKAKINNETSV